MNPRDVKLAYRQADTEYAELIDGRYPRTTREAFGHPCHVAPANDPRERIPLSHRPMRGWRVHWTTDRAQGVTTTVARTFSEAARNIRALVTGARCWVEPLQ